MTNGLLSFTKFYFLSPKFLTLYPKLFPKHLLLCHILWKLILWHSEPEAQAKGGRGVKRLTTVLIMFLDAAR